jgi:hypothetical protein
MTVGMTTSGRRIPFTPTPTDVLGWLGLRRVRVEELLDAWRFAAEDAALALAAWRSAPRDLRRDAYHVYRAALDREAKAADVLAFRRRPRWVSSP